MAHATNTQFTVGVHMLTLLASLGPGPTSSEEMADSADASPVYVRRVLGRLRQAGLVASRPGVGGGWVLLRNPEEITLGDVWRAIHGDAPLLGLHEVNPRCEVGHAIQHNLTIVDRRAVRAVEAELDALTVAEMLPVAARISYQGRPVARIVAVQRRRPVAEAFGVLRGEIELAYAFDEPPAEIAEHFS